MARFQLHQSLEYVTVTMIFHRCFSQMISKIQAFFVGERGRERERDPNSDVYGGNRWNQMNKSTCFSCLPVSTRWSEILFLFLTRICQVQFAMPQSYTTVCPKTGDALPQLSHWAHQVAWSARARLCVTLGTSLCGMTSDEIPRAAAERFAVAEGDGLVPWCG